MKISKDECDKDFANKSLTLSDEKCSKLQMQSGSKWVSFANGNNSSISFSPAFTSVPLVVCYVEGADGNGFAGCASIDVVNVTNVTTTGFTVWHERTDASSNQANIVWKAICVI